MPKSAAKTKTPPPAPQKKQSIPHPSAAKNANADLSELLLTGIRELYWAENHLVQNLPKIQDAADNPLRKAVAEHWRVTKGHVARLEKAFGILGAAPLGRKCDGMEGLVMEGEGVINATKSGSASRMAGLIMACQKVENYEMTAYRGLALLATRLGHSDLLELFEATLAEEKEADITLSALADRK